MQSSTNLSIAKVAANEVETGELLSKNQGLEQEMRHLTRELKQHDHLYMKYKDLKLDYKQVLDALEKSESIRRQ